MFAELFSGCSQAPPSLLPPERVASLNFSWCETSDCCQTSAICSFRVQLWIVYAETIKQWLINLILPEVVFKQEKNFVNHIIGKVFSIFKKIKMKKNWSLILLWRWICLASKSWGNGVHRWDFYSNKGDSHEARDLPSAPLSHWLCGGVLHSLNWPKMEHEATRAMTFRLMSRWCSFDFLQKLCDLFFRVKSELNAIWE